LLICNFFFYHGVTASAGPEPPHCRCMSDQSDVETSTWQHTIFIRDGRPCPRRDSKTQSQKQSGRRPMP